MIEVDATQFTSKVRETLNIWQNLMSQALKLSDHFLKVIKDRTPVDTGETRKSWTIKIHRADRDAIIWEIYPDEHEDIVTFLEWGTREHVILPREAGGVLVFEDKGTGETVFARNVYHPGTKPLGIVRITQDEIDLYGKRLSDLMVSKISALWT